MTDSLPLIMYIIGIVFILAGVILGLNQTYATAKLYTKAGRPRRNPRKLTTFQQLALHRAYLPTAWTAFCVGAAVTFTASLAL